MVAKNILLVIIQNSLPYFCYSHLFHYLFYNNKCDHPGIFDISRISILSSDVIVLFVSYLYLFWPIIILNIGVYASYKYFINKLILQKNLVLHSIIYLGFVLAFYMFSTLVWSLILIYFDFPSSIYDGYPLLKIVYIVFMPYSSTMVSGYLLSNLVFIILLTSVARISNMNKLF
jgi:hypothetical protein